MWSHSKLSRITYYNDFIVVCEFVFIIYNQFSHRASLVGGFLNEYAIFIYFLFMNTSSNDMTSLFWVLELYYISYYRTAI